MEGVRVAFMTVVAVAVLLLFGAGIYMAAYYTLWVKDKPKPELMPKVVSYFVSAVNGTLAANLGALLGISISLRGWNEPSNMAAVLQWVAAGWYVAMLISATVLWGKAAFTEEPTKVVSVLPELTKNGIGIFIAILAAVLGVETLMARGQP